ncbi:hypothetical protein HNQ94_000436 [Salirhabdus euzebyi]|uniref:Uncharacterized protein n=1 Tax=Salirhabdus euzebyi TaxID=394506 RepID=A0A841Q1Y5_9BACI|nr:hypothetical protein [Salirhabdus euzebyi]MBB6452015.1 hypothetical protein [Salirhabdus euzebyi]
MNNEFLLVDQEKAEKLRATGIYILARIKIAFEHSQFDEVKKATDSLFEVAGELERLRQKKEVVDRNKIQRIKDSYKQDLNTFPVKLDVRK